MTAAPIAARNLPVDTLAMARWLIGKRVLRQLGGVIAGGRIVETEAYLEDDPASHSYSGPTQRNRAMFARRGHAYIYRIYGLHYCLNVASGAVGRGAAVLIRALEPECGVPEMERRRAHAPMRDLARGPGRLCAALEIDLGFNGVDLCRADSALWLAPGQRQPGEIGVSARIGIAKAANAPLRFYERGNPFVSGPKWARN